MIGVNLRKNLLEPGRAGRENLLVALDALAVRAQSDVAEELVVQVAPEGGVDLVIIVGPGQHQVLVGHR